MAALLFGKSEFLMALCDRRRAHKHDKKDTLYWKLLKYENL
jgi:hypothetical protein